MTLRDRPPPIKEHRWRQGHSAMRPVGVPRIARSIDPIYGMGIL
jgi:hypothetical protein